MIFVAPAFAEPAEVRSETLLQPRSDQPGALFLGGMETLGGTASFGQTRLEGYGDLGFPSGFDTPFGGELYLLAADGAAGAVRWTVGRQPLLLPTWSRRLDGGTLRWDVDKHLTLSTAVGVASRSGLPGTYDGAPVARFSGTWSRGGLRAVAGVWGEAGAVPTAHGDVEAHWGAPTSKVAPELGMIGALVTRDGEMVLERGRVEAGLLPGSGVRALAWFEHREALTDGSLLSPAILATFAPTGTDAVGLATGVSTERRARLWASGSVQQWSPDADAERMTALLGEVRWEPSCGPERWCFGPSWQGAAGDGGAYHRSGAILSLPLPSAVELDVNGAWVPYRKPHLDWRSAWVAGVLARVATSRRLTFEAGADVLLDGSPPATRGWLAVQLRAGGAP